MKKFAVLVLNYNGKHFLETCFTSLLKQSSINFDIYLIDNNSSDKSREYTKANFPSVKIINTNDNLGYTGAYNHAYKVINKSKIKYEYLLFLNNDIEADRSLIRELTFIFEHEKDAGIVVPAVVNDKMILDSLGGKFIFLTGTTYGYKNGIKYKRGKNTVKCFWASGCALAIRTQNFIEIGLFNDYFIYYEDVDISWKVNNLGYSVLATDRTYVKHFQGGAKTPSHLQLYLTERNRLLNYWQNLPNSIYIFIIPFLIIMRLGLIFYMSKNRSNLLSKLKGIHHGLFFIFKYKKKKYSMLKHLSVIYNMNKIQIFRL